jgi:lysophospholipase L1-like esterase
MADRKKYKINFYHLVVALFITTLTISCNKKINSANLQPYTNIPSSLDTSVTLSPSTDTSTVPPSSADASFIPPSSTDTFTKTYLALGDSYTIGQSVAEAERYPNQTVQLLRNENIKLSDPKIIATTGWTTGNLINALNLNALQNNYSLVSLLIGVNNQYQGRSIDEYKTEFTLLVNRSIQYAGNNKSNVFVLSIPDYSVTPFASNSDKQKIASEIDSFNTINKTISDSLGVHYINITTISKDALNDPALIADDGLHPSGKQYKRWAELLAPMMKKAL